MGFIHVPALLDFPSHLFHTVLITDGRLIQWSKNTSTDSDKIYQNPPEGMTPKLVRNMTDSDLLDMHYFLTEDDDFDDEELRRLLYWPLLTTVFFVMPASGGHFYPQVLQTENFPLI